MDSGSRSRREALGLMGAAAGAALAYPLLANAPAGALGEEPPTFEGQIGPATTYTTLKGTACWMVDVHAGPPGSAQDDYHYARVLVPKTLDVSVPTPTALVLHGATALEDCITRGGGMTTLAGTWLDGGWAVIASRNGSNVNAKGKGINAKWGNEPSRRALVDAWRWAQGAWTPDPHGFLVFGFSMGALVAMNYVAEARMQRVPVAAVYSLDGALNLADAATRSAAFHKQVKLAYGLPNYSAGDANWVAKVDGADGGHDPIRFASSLRPCPLRLASSINDNTIKQQYHTLPFVNILRTAGWLSELSVLSYTGGHCAVKHFNPKDVTPFFVRALQLQNAAPVASFSVTTTDLTAFFDGSASTDADDTVVGHAWDFGDGTTGAGAVVDHTYAEAGTYPVTLTVTDESGAQGTATAAVTVPEPVEPPPEDPPPEDPPPEDPPPEDPPPDE